MSLDSVLIKMNTDSTDTSGVRRSLTVLGKVIPNFSLGIHGD